MVKYHDIPWYTTVYHVMSWFTMICHGISYHGVSYHGIPWYIFIRVLAVVSPYKELSLMSVSNLLFVLISIKKIHETINTLDCF